MWPNEKTSWVVQYDEVTNPRWRTILGHNFGVDQHFCAKFGTEMVNRQHKGSQSLSAQKSDFPKSNMADGRHLGFRFWPIIRRRATFLHQVWYNERKAQPKATYCSESSYRKSKITDGHHLEFLKSYYNSVMD